MEKGIKILKFERKKEELLSEDDITKIFMGLMGLMRKSAEYTALKSVEKKLKSDSEKINCLTKKLELRSKQLEEVLKINEELKERK